MTLMAQRLAPAQPKPMSQDRQRVCSELGEDAVFPRSFSAPGPHLAINQFAESRSSQECHLQLWLREAERKLSEKDHRIGVLEGRCAFLLQRLLEAERRLDEVSRPVDQPCRVQGEHAKCVTILASKSQGAPKSETQASRESLISTCASTCTISSVSSPVPRFRLQSWSTDSLSDWFSQTDSDSTQVGEDMDTYATAADLDAVCRKSEGLLRALSVVVPDEYDLPEPRTREVGTSPRRPVDDSDRIGNGQVVGECFLAGTGSRYRGSAPGSDAGSCRGHSQARRNSTGGVGRPRPAFR